MRTTTLVVIGGIAVGVSIAAGVFLYKRRRPQSKTVQNLERDQPQSVAASSESQVEVELNPMVSDLKPDFGGLRSLHLGLAAGEVVGLAYSGHACVRVGLPLEQAVVNAVTHYKISLLPRAIVSLGATRAVLGHFFHRDELSTATLEHDVVRASIAEEWRTRYGAPDHGSASEVSDAYVRSLNNPCLAALSGMAAGVLEDPQDLTGAALTCAGAISPLASARAAAVALARAVHHLHHGGERSELLRVCSVNLNLVDGTVFGLLRSAAELPDYHDDPEPAFALFCAASNGEGRGLREAPAVVVSAALYVMVHARSVGDALLSATSFGGESASVAAVCGALGALGFRDSHEPHAAWLQVLLSEHSVASFAP